MRFCRALSLATTVLVTAVLVLPSAPALAVTPNTVRTSWQLAGLSSPAGQDGYVAAPGLDCPSADFCAMTSDLRYATTLTRSSVRTVDVSQHDDGDTYSVVSVSCATAGDCVATGEHDHGPCCGSSSYRVDLAGSDWTAEPNAGSNAWQDVACNTERCVNVGTAYVGTELGAIDDRAAGQSWVSRKVVTPWNPEGNGFSTTVQSVACPRPTGACVATGTGQPSFSDPAQPLVFLRKANVWKGVLQALPAGAPAASNGAQQLSCPAAGTCLGLGTWSDGATGHLFLERVSDGVASAKPLAVPSGLIDGDVVQVKLDCATATSCAGEFISSGGGAVLVRYHADRWSFTRPGLPAGGLAGSSPIAMDVSCAALHRCVAVGWYLTNGPTSVKRAAIWTWSGGQWVAQDPGVPAGVQLGDRDDETLDAISCGAWTRCVVLGAAGDHAFYGVGSFSS